MVFLQASGSVSNLPVRLRREPFSFPSFLNSHIGVSAYEFGRDVIQFTTVDKGIWKWWVHGALWLGSRREGSAEGETYGKLGKVCGFLPAAGVLRRWSLCPVLTSLASLDCLFGRCLLCAKLHSVCGGWRQHRPYLQGALSPPALCRDSALAGQWPRSIFFKTGERSTGKGTKDLGEMGKIILEKLSSEKPSILIPPDTSDLRAIWTPLMSWAGPGCSVVFVTLAQWFSVGGNFTRRHLSMSRDMFYCHDWVKGREMLLASTG